MLPDKTVLPPPIINLSGPAFAMALSYTCTFTEPLSVHPPASVNSTAYLLSVAGEAIGFAILVAESPIAGDHVKLPLPLADNCMLLPLQREVSVKLNAKTGEAFTATVVPAVAVQPAALVTVTS